MSFSCDITSSSDWETIDFRIDSIDLTQDPQPRLQDLNDLIICIDSDSSFDQSRIASPLADTLTNKRIVKENTGRAFQQPKKKTSTISKKSKAGKLGDCPICFDPLGRNPLASTKCGHVFCSRCLERALQSEKKCPTCRRSMKGCNSYHPLYIGSAE